MENYDIIVNILDNSKIKSIITLDYPVEIDISGLESIDISKCTFENLKNKIINKD